MYKTMLHHINFEKMDAVLTEAKVKDDDIEEYLMRRYGFTHHVALDYACQYLSMRGRR